MSKCSGPSCLPFAAAAVVGMECFSSLFSMTCDMLIIKFCEIILATMVFRVLYVCMHADSVQSERVSLWVYVKGAQQQQRQIGQKYIWYGRFWISGSDSKWILFTHQLYIIISSYVLMLLLLLHCDFSPKKIDHSVLVTFCMCACVCVLASCLLARSVSFKPKWFMVDRMCTQTA